MRERDGSVGGKMEWESHKRDILIESHPYGVREKPGARESPRSPQG